MVCFVFHFFLLQRIFFKSFLGVVFLPIGSHYSNNTIAPLVATAAAAASTAVAHPPLKSNHSVSSNPSPSPVYDSSKFSSISNKALKYQAYGQRDAQHTPPMSHSSAIGSQKTIVIDDEPALDLRNTSKSQSSTELNTTQVCTHLNVKQNCYSMSENRNTTVKVYLQEFIQNTTLTKMHHKLLNRQILIMIRLC